MRTMILAAVAALALTACNQGGGGPALPRVQEGATAPSTLTPQPGTRQGQVDDATRTNLLAYIDQQLDQIQGATGMTPVENGEAIVPMQPGTDNRMVLALTAGTPYSFVGACDDDCNNVDIELISMTTGGVVASDMLADDFPIVNYTPSENGQYMVRLILQTCTMAPCFAGSRALSGVAGGAAQPAAATEGGTGDK